MRTVDEMTGQTPRQAATAHLQDAGVAINAMFDRQDDVEATLSQIAEIAASDANVFTRSQGAIDQATILVAQIEALRTAAAVASAHRAKRALAKDLAASPNVVFSSQNTVTIGKGPAAVAQSLAS